MRKPLLLALAIMIWLSLRPGMADQAVTPASLVPCPYTPEEIQAALGLTVDAGEAADMTFPAGRDVGCIYQVVGGSTTLAVRQTWAPAGSTGASHAEAGKTESTKAIPGDADGAQWKLSGPTDGEPQVELGYSRGKVQTRVSVHGRSFRSSDLQSKLLLLKRVP